MLVLPASLTHREAPDAVRMLAQTIRSESADKSSAAPPLSIDASALQQFDSSALAVLLECQRQAQAWGRAFSVRQPPSKLSALAKLYGVDGLLLGAVPAA